MNDNETFSSLPVRGSRPGKIVQMTEAEVRGLCIKSREIFLSQPILLELEAPLKICGQCWTCSSPPTRNIISGFAVVVPPLEPLLTMIFVSASRQIKCCLDAKLVFWHSYMPGFCPKKNCSQTVIGLYLCACAPIWAHLSPKLKMPALKLYLAGAHNSLHTPTCFISLLQYSAATVNNPERSNIFSSTLKCSTHTYLLRDFVTIKLQAVAFRLIMAVKVSSSYFIVFLPL